MFKAPPLATAPNADESIEKLQQATNWMYYKHSKQWGIKLIKMTTWYDKRIEVTWKNGNVSSI